MVDVEAALARMRARRRETPAAKRPAIPGYEYDTEKDRYFKAAKKKTTKPVEKAERRPLLVEGARRQAEASLLLSRCRCEPHESSRVRNATCAAAREHVVVGGFNQLAVGPRLVAWDHEIVRVDFVEDRVLVLDRSGLRVGDGGRIASASHCSGLAVHDGRAALCGHGLQLVDVAATRRVASAKASDALVVGFYDDRVVWCGHRNGRVSLFDFRHRRWTRLFQLGAGVDDVVPVAAWTLAASDWRGGIAIFDARRAQTPLVSLAGHVASPVATGLVAVPGFCVAGGADALVRAWRLLDGCLVATARFPRRRDDCPLIAATSRRQPASRCRTSLYRADDDFAGFYDHLRVPFVARDHTGDIALFTTTGAAPHER